MPKSTETHAAHGGHELSDVNLKFFASVMVGLFILLLMGMSVGLWYQNAMTEQQRAAETPPWPLAGTRPQRPPEPRLQEAPANELEKFHAEEDKVLNNYEWVDAKTGIVRIPIERAIELTAQRGLPARETSAAAGGSGKKEVAKSGSHEAKK